MYEKARLIYKELGDEIALSLVLGDIGEAEFAVGNFEGALRAASEALAQSGPRGAYRSAVPTCNRAGYQLALGDLVGARSSARDALAIAVKVQERYTLAIALQHCALLAALEGQRESAARLMGYVDLQYRALGTAREPTEKWCYDKLLASLREKLSDAEIEKLGTEGAAWSEDQAVEEALKL